MTNEIVIAIITAILSAAGGSMLTFRAVNRKTNAETVVTLDTLNNEILERVQSVMALEAAHFEREIKDLQGDNGALMARIEQMEQDRTNDRSRIDRLESSMIIALDYIQKLRDLLVVNHITPPPLPTNLLDWQRSRGE